MRDGRTDGRTEWNQYTPPPTSLFEGGGGYNEGLLVSSHHQNQRRYYRLDIGNMFKWNQIRPFKTKAFGNVNFKLATILFHKYQFVFTFTFTTMRVGHDRYRAAFNLRYNYSWIPTVLDLRPGCVNSLITRKKCLPFWKYTFVIEIDRTCIVCVL